MQRFFPFIIILVLVSCKAKQQAISAEPNVVSVSNDTVSNIIKHNEALKLNFKTAVFKAKINYDDPNRSMNLSSEIRIKKDEIILVSVKMLGFVMAKAIITPTQVRYYEKANNKFFEGDYKTLSNWLGTDLDFQKVQNIMLGKAMDDLKKEQYNFLTEDNAPKLEEKNNAQYVKSYVFDPVTFVLKKQEINQALTCRNLKVNYLNHKMYPEVILPEELLIFAMQNNQKTTIGIEYKNATFNEELTFPYNVPNGYEQIIIK
jgi:Domain of unknown function (DUF4292)